MERFIDRDRMYQKLHEAGGCGADKGSWADGWDKAIDEAIRILENEQTVEIIRCRNCKLWEEYENTAGSGYCHCKKFQFHYGPRMDRIFNPITGPNEYCSFAERKDENEET